MSFYTIVYQTYALVYADHKQSISGKDTTPMTRVTDQDFLHRLREVMDQYHRRNQAAHAAKITTDQLSRYLRGASEPNFMALARLCKGVGYSLNWLAFGQGPKQSLTNTQNTLPIHGLSEAKQKGWYQSLEWATSLSLDMKDDKAFAIVARGDEMVPEGIREGTVCVCAPGEKPQRGDVVYVERMDGYSALRVYGDQERDWVMFKGYLPADEGGSQLPYNDKIQKSHIKTIAPVVIIKKRL